MGIVLILVLALAADVVAAVLNGGTRGGTTPAADVTITNESLVFTPTHPVSFTVRSAGTVQWTVDDGERMRRPAEPGRRNAR